MLKVPWRRSKELKRKKNKAFTFLYIYKSSVWAIRGLCCCDVEVMGHQGVNDPLHACGHVPAIQSPPAAFTHKQTAKKKEMSLLLSTNCFLCSGCS